MVRLTFTKGAAVDGGNLATVRLVQTRHKFTDRRSIDSAIMDEHLYVNKWTALDRDRSDGTVHNLPLPTTDLRQRCAHSGNQALAIFRFIRRTCRYDAQGRIVLARR